MRNGQEIIKELTANLAAKAIPVPPTDTAIINLLRSMNSVETHHLVFPSECGQGNREICAASPP